MPKSKGAQRQQATVELKLSIVIQDENPEVVRKRLAKVVAVSGVEVVGEKAEIVDMKIALNFKKNRMERLTEGSE